jgi:phosphatidylserine/phosphatidylglycerophosphate/cardiolipin synthase-like enzyme
VAYAAPRRAPALTSPELAAFLRAPSFAGYVRVLRASRLGLSSHGGAPEDGLRARILREVRALRAEVEQAPQPVPGISASRLLELEAQRGRAAAIRDRAIAGPMRAALLDDAEYPQFLLQLLQAAQASVHVVMFFMRFEDAARYPTDDLLDALVAARRRGADVRVILDRDAEGDAIGSRVVNDEAHRFLRKSGVPVVWDAEDRYTHSKLVVVDGAHVVVGSHNWTAGSFWAYDDLSAYVESKALAATYDARFETLWTTYGGSRLPGRSARVRGQARRRSAHAPQTRAAARGRRA